MGSAVTRNFIVAIGITPLPLVLIPALPNLDRQRTSQFICTMTNQAPGSKGEVWMLDTFGNVHSLVNACKQLGFKVNRVTDPDTIAISHRSAPLSLSQLIL